MNVMKGHLKKKKVRYSSNQTSHEHEKILGFLRVN